MTALIVAWWVQLIAGSLSAACIPLPSRWLTTEERHGVVRDCV